MVYHEAPSSSDPAGPSREDEHAPGFCGELFIITRDLFNALQLSGRLSDPESDEAFLAQNEAGRFRLWGDGFDVLEGGLDELLDGSALRSAVVEQLVGIARKLRRYVERDSELFRTLESMLEKAEYIYPEAIEVEDEHWTELTLLETLEDVAILNDGLYELTPFLESIPIEYEENDELENSRQRTADPGQITATKALHINILDKFPGAADNLPLVENLAERNMRRKERLWELKKKHESASEPVSPSNGRGGRAHSSPSSRAHSSPSSRAHSPSSYAPSTKYTMGTMRTFGSSVASVPYSLLDLQQDYAPSMASMSSFASVDLEMVGRTRIPPPPVRLGDGVSFECNLCFETLHDVETKYRWKKHVLKDLQPYSCSFLHCPFPATHLFNSRTEWVNHEFEVHRLLPSWTCITDCGKEFDNQEAFRRHVKEAHLGTAGTENELGEIVKKCERRKPLPKGQTTVCPLCRETIPETKTSIRRHLGRHMEEISLAVVPTENYNLEWEESTEDESVSSSEDEQVLKDEMEEEEEEEQNGDLQRLRKEIEWRTVVPIANKLLNCVLEIQASNRKLLHLHNQPHWRREVFELAQVYDAGREGGRDIMSDDICRRTRERCEQEPSYARMKNQYGSPEEYDAYLDERLKGVFQQRQAFFDSFLGFRQCHLCKEVALPDQSATRTDKCPQCQHHHCQACPRASVFPPSLRSQAEINLRVSFPELQTKPPDPVVFTSSQPTPSINLQAEASRASSQSSESPSGSRPSTPPARRGRPKWRPLSEEMDPGRLSVDDGFQVVTNKKAGKQAARRTSASSYASSIAGPDEVTRTIQINPKHYALLIGVGGGTLSDIIAGSGGPSLKAAQSRIVQFPKQDSPSDRVVVRGPPQMVDAIIDRIKAKIEAFEAWSARKEKQKLRFSLPVSEQKRPESSGSVWPGTISVGRAHTGQKNPNLVRRATEEEMQEALDKVGTTEPEPRSIKSASRKHRKKRPNPDRRASEVQV